MDKITIKFFGVLSEVAGTTEEEIPISVDTKSLLDLLKQKYSDLSGLQYSVAVNQVISGENRKISAGDEIALLPPFTGG